VVRRYLEALDAREGNGEGCRWFDQTGSGGHDVAELEQAFVAAAVGADHDDRRSGAERAQLPEGGVVDDDQVDVCAGGIRPRGWQGWLPMPADLPARVEFEELGDEASQDRVGHADDGVMKPAAMPTALILALRAGAAHTPILSGGAGGAHSGEAAVPLPVVRDFSGSVPAAPRTSPPVKWRTSSSPTRRWLKPPLWAFPTTNGERWWLPPSSCTRVAPSPPKNSPTGCASGCARLERPPASISATGFPTARPANCSAES